MFFNVVQRCYRSPWCQWIPGFHSGPVDTWFVGAVRQQCHRLETYSDERLKQRSQTLRQQFQSSKRRLFFPYIVDAFGLMTEAVRRTSGKTYYDAQLLGGLALTRGAIAEMQTGEGKTLTCGLPAFTHGLFGKGIHVATTNAYLARRDYEKLRPALELLDLKVGHLPEQRDLHTARQAYRCNVTFGTGYDFCFDFLRDQIALRNKPKLRLGGRHMARVAGQNLSNIHLLQQTHHYAIIDEADSVLIDEAMMPLVLSAATPDSTSNRLLQLAALLAEQFILDQHYTIDNPKRLLAFTDEGWEALHAPLHQDILPRLKRPWSTYVEQALRAKIFLKQDIDYVVVNDQIHIVDQFTGRIHPERTWQNGLHQAVEILHGLPCSSEKKLEGQISRQRYYRFYKKICGMTGTAVGNEIEFENFYGLPVIEIPTHRPSQRKYLPSRYFTDSPTRDQAIVQDVLARQQMGQPVLIGTRTIRHSKQLAERFDHSGIPYTLLNGLQNEEEAQIVARAGCFKAVTIATNMAGRGTDIQPDVKALQAGGLHVIAAEHNPSRRIDRQLAGRTARQGNPGSVQFFVAADDELFATHNHELSNTIVTASNVAEEANHSLDSEIHRLQNQLEQEHYQRRCEMVQRDNWLENILQLLAARGEMTDAT